MSLAAHAVPALARRTGSRWLLLGSLALNLFFVGVALALAIRAPAPPTRWDPNVFVRIDRLAATLPAADAGVLKGMIAANHAAIENTQDRYHAARDEIRATLRQNPFKVEDMRAAMAKTRTARQSFALVIQGVFADAAAKISPAGRLALADWRIKAHTGGSNGNGH
jgi:uncharacterized membrane protein